MSTAHINYLNIGLMLASLVAAMALPFEVFLFSYAVLGPLHYLTEISWLHDRQYFTQRKWDWTILAAITLMLGGGSAYLLEDYAISGMTRISADLMFVGFGLALLFVVTARWWIRCCGAIALITATAWFHGSSYQQIIFMLYLPTIIHVFIFTGAFILFGSLKYKHPSGHLSFAIFLLCAVACFLIKADTDRYVVSDYVQKNYQPFVMLNLKLNELLSFPRLSKASFFTSDANLMITRFIAWAYTYHYLNWFSKTSIIGWHKISKLRLAAVVLLWVGSVTLYCIDYALGFKWLFLLSFAHVFLEFPLNHRSFIGIGSELAAWCWAPVLAAGTSDGSQGGSPNARRQAEQLRKRKR